MKLLTVLTAVFFLVFIYGCGRILFSMLKELREIMIEAWRDTQTE